ncbi:MAG: PAS domain S-box protein [candidate division Zixibacteria bacterium]|nr:PAS domain S-box protein [candidate division Zixibacteria bacterium]
MNTKKRSLKRGLFKRYSTSISIGLIGLALSLTVFFFVGEWETKWRKSVFDQLAESRCNSFRSEIHQHLHELMALKRFYDGSQFVSREEFDQFVTPIFCVHQDLRGFGWAPRVTDTDRNVFEQTLQAEGLANYQIHDSSVPGEMEIAAHHKEYYPVLYRTPQLDWAIGLNQFSQSLRREAIEQARDMNQVVITGPTIFPSELKNRFGTITFAPVYKKGMPTTTVEERRAAIEGIVICAMGVGDILESVIGELQPGGIDISVSDLSAPEGEQLLFHHTSRLRNAEEDDLTHQGKNGFGLSFVTSFEVANRTWEMHCTPSSGYLTSHPVWINWILLLGGLILTSLLAAFVYTRQTRMAVIEELVDKRTAQLRASEQQLKATNQQLRAGEQQLKAANQQLKAQEQQLRASNQQLRASEENYRLLIDSVDAGINLIDREGNFLLVNDRSANMMGISPADLIGKNISNVMPPDYLALAMERLNRVVETGVGEVHEMFVEQFQRWFLENLQPVKNTSGETIGIQVMSQDITERKQYDDALLKSKEVAENYLNVAAEIIISLNAEGTITLLNESGHSTLGYNKGDLIGKNWFDTCLPARLRNEVGIVFNKLMQGEIEEVITYENPIVTKSGGEKIILWHNTLLRDEAGNICGSLSSGEDITERKQAEEALQESETKFRTYVSHAPDAIFIANALGSFVDVNLAASKITGYSRSELLSMSVLDLADPKARPEELESFKRLMEIGRENSETKLKRKDGSIIWVSLDAVSLSEDRLMAFISDITETKRLRELESRAQRLESAGKISGQIAHDFNNLLAPLIAYPEFIREELPKNHPALTYLTSIEDSAARIADINQQLLTLGRRGHYNQQVMNLNEIIMRAVKEMDALPATMTCKMQLDEDLMNVMGGGAQIHRVISNLLTNAQDAIQDVGQITVKTENYYVDEMCVAYGRVPKGEYVKMTLSDTGCGIPDDIIQKIFDPFFTSKTTDKKRGSGLGLSVVDSVLKDHNGYLDLSSKVGQGTSFYLYFPITREDVGISEIQQSDGGTETILVVDDDELQRDVSMKLLSKLGYKVSTAESGEKAIEFLKDNPQDLLVMDMVMPMGIDGAETYRQVAEFNPGQKAIIVSGFSETDRVLEAQKFGAGAFVKKPLTVKDVAAAVRMELDR